MPRRRLSLLSCFTAPRVDKELASPIGHHLEATCNAEQTSTAVASAQATSTSGNLTDGTSCNPSELGHPGDANVHPAKSVQNGNATAALQSKCAHFEALPFSWAVLSCDARNVLHHHLGQEPAAAKVCSQALQEYESSSSLPSESAQGTQHVARPESRQAYSFLTALMGPQLEAAALKRTQMGRPFKGTVCMQLPVKGRPFHCSAHCNTHLSSEISAAMWDQVQRAEDVEGVESCMGKGGDTEVPLKAPEQQLRCKGSQPTKFQGVTPDEDEAKGGQESSLMLLSQDFPGQLERKGTLDHLHERFEGDYELLDARGGGVSADVSKELPSSPFSEAAQQRPPPDNAAGPPFFDSAKLRPLSDTSARSPVHDSSKLQPSSDTSAHLDSSIQAGEKDAQGQIKSDMDISEIQSSRLKRKHFWRGQTCPGPMVLSRKSSLQISEREIDQFLSGGAEEGSFTKNVRTKAFLKSLSHPEVKSNAPDLDKMEHTAQRWSYPPALTQCTILEDDIESFVSTSASRGKTERLPCWGSVEGSELHGFDVVVSALDQSEGKKSPLLVMISDSTEHVKAREILTALAESQLELLANIMPQHAMQFLATESSEAVKDNVGQLARAHESATLMFMDICGFTSMSKEVEPVQVMGFLNTLFSHFDKLVDIHGVHKVETAGDCYIVSGGIMKQAADGFGQSVEESHDPEESAQRVMAFAKAILDVAGQVQMPNTQQPVCIRIGMHTGDVVSGMIGTKLPKFSVFGDAMNTASRMESTGVPGRIHASEATRKLLPHELWAPTGGIDIKGKGRMETYLWIPQLLKSSNNLHSDASTSHAPPARLRSAPQPLPSHISHTPAIHLFHSSKNAHSVVSHDALKEWEGGWEINSFDLRDKSAGQQCLNAMASISSSLLPSKINKATQILSLLGNRGILLHPNGPAKRTRGLEGSSVASQQGCVTTGAVSQVRENSYPPQELGAF